MIRRPDGRKSSGWMDWDHMQTVSCRLVDKRLVDAGIGGVGIEKVKRARLMKRLGNREVEKTLMIPPFPFLLVPGISACFTSTFFLTRPSNQPFTRSPIVLSRLPFTFSTHRSLPLTLVTSITFLKSCETDHSVPEDSIESLQVASQCLSDAFGVDPDSADDVEKYDLGAGKGLMDVWGIVRGVAAKRGQDGDAAKGKTSASKDTSSTAKETAKDATTTASSTNKEPTASDKSQAEALKAEGNALITRRLYSSAVEKYTAAIALDPGNAVYYSNRAAAWGAMGEHAEAVKDAEEAVKRDPVFGRGWSRLG